MVTQKALRVSEPLIALVGNEGKENQLGHRLGENVPPEKSSAFRALLGELSDQGLD